MNKIPILCALLATVLTGTGCSHSSAVTVGTKRAAILPQNVKLYLRPPANYEEIALINANNMWGSPFGQQAKVNTVINRMKAEAARLGANGLVINEIGDQNIGSIGNASWNGYVNGNTVTAFGSGMSTNMMLKIGSAVAIYVH